MKTVITSGPEDSNEDFEVEGLTDLSLKIVAKVFSRRHQ